MIYLDYLLNTSNLSSLLMFAKKLLFLLQYFPGILGFIVMISAKMFALISSMVGIHFLF